MAANRRDWPLAISRFAADFGEDMLRTMQEAGIRCMELSTNIIEPYTEYLDYPHRSREISAKAKEYGVTIGSLHLPFTRRTDYTTDDPEDRQFMFDLQSGLIRAAAEAGVEHVVIHPSCEPYPEEERESRIGRAVEIIGRLTETAVSAGTVLAVENLPRTCLCRTSEEMQRFLTAIPDLRVCFDTNHSLIEPNPAYIRAVGDRIVTLHVSDYDFTDERHWMPMEGKIDWAELLSVLEEVHYSGRFTYEISWAVPADRKIVENYYKLMSL